MECRLSHLLQQLVYIFFCFTSVLVSRTMYCREKSEGIVQKLLKIIIGTSSAGTKSESAAATVNDNTNETLNDGVVRALGNVYVSLSNFIFYLRQFNNIFPATTRKGETEQTVENTSQML